MARDKITADSVKRAELDLILNRQPGGHTDDPPLWGLALSGGGIRSATFALGVLQVLARNKLLNCFHYVSTISGGGYAGAFLQGLICRRGYEGMTSVLSSSVTDAANASQPAEPTADVHQPIRHLREYSNYLSPRKTAVSGDTLAMLGTYARNLLLIQTQLFVFVLTASLIPPLIFPLMLRAAAHWPYGLFVVALAIAVVAATLFGWVLDQSDALGGKSQNDAIRRGSAKLPNVSESKAQDSAAPTTTAPRDRPSPAVVRGALAAIGLLFVAVLVGTTALWGLNANLYGAIHAATSPSAADDLTTELDLKILWMAGVTYFVLWMLWLVMCLATSHPRISPENWNGSPPIRRYGLRFVLATLGASFFTGCALVAVRHIFYHWVGIVGLWHALVLGPTCVLSAITLAGIFHIGLSGPALTDLQREIWARVGGRVFAFVTLAVGLASAIVVYGPLLLRYGLWFTQSAWTTTTGWLGVLGWLGTTGAGLFAAYSQRATGDAKASSIGFEILARVAPWVFLGGLAILVSFAGQEILGVVGWDPMPSLRPSPSLSAADIAPTYLASLSRGTLLHYGTLAIVASLSFAIWLVFGYAIDLNEFSLNAFYRNRIVRCYLGASNSERKPEPTTNFDPLDDLHLADIVRGARDANEMRPLYPLIGTALNLVDTKQLDWQDRKAASFCFTPGYCGYIPPPSHAGASPVGDPTSAIAGTADGKEKADHARPIARSLTLGDVTAISGAAVSPNMGYHSSPAVTLLLTLFDARLGWWLPNPNIRGNDAANVPRFSGWWLITEMLGLTNEHGRLIYLSDGGHFDNLGLYELIRRKCRFIVCVDATADEQRDFADLGDAVQKCRIDFGVEIQIDTSGLAMKDGLSKTCFSVGDIKYPSGDPGKLLYLKPSLVGNEPTDVAHYAKAHPTFPHESTADQFFDESQFESYRRLGESAAVGSLQAAVDRACGPTFRSDNAPSPGLVDSLLRVKLFEALIQS